MSDGVHCDCLKVAGAPWDAESNETHREVIHATTERLFELRHYYYSPLGTVASSTSGGDWGKESTHETA
jgi:hypothetical protein